jgi:hypothetical protein
VADHVLEEQAVESPVIGGGELALRSRTMLVITSACAW